MDIKTFESITLRNRLDREYLFALSKLNIEYSNCIQLFWLGSEDQDHNTLLLEYNDAGQIKQMEIVLIRGNRIPVLITKDSYLLLYKADFDKIGTPSKYYGIAIKDSIIEEYKCLFDLEDEFFYENDNKEELLSKVTPESFRKMTVDDFKHNAPKQISRSVRANTIRALTDYVISDILYIYQYSRYRILIEANLSGSKNTAETFDTTTID